MGYCIGLAALLRTEVKQLDWAASMLMLYQTPASSLSRFGLGLHDFQCVAGFSAPSFFLRVDSRDFSCIYCNKFLCVPSLALGYGIYPPRLEITLVVSSFALFGGVHSPPSEQEFNACRLADESFLTIP